MAIGRRMSIASSIKSARRRSLPAMTSMISLDSEYSITTPEADVTTFQVRRRKAAKLTQFFGVDYRELISDILQSIETGLENEHENGTLRAEEAEVCHPLIIVHVTLIKCSYRICLLGFAISKINVTIFCHLCK